MRSYLDSPQYQRMLAQTLQGQGGRPQYPMEAGANALAQMLQMYSLKTMGEKQDAEALKKETAGNQSLADIIAPPEYRASGQNAVEASAPISFEGIGGQPQQTTINAGLPAYEAAPNEKNAQLVALLNQGIGKDAIGKMALKNIGLGDTMDPKDRYMNVPGVGMVDLMADGGPKPVVRERLKGGPGDVFLDQTDAGLAPAFSVKDPNKPFNADSTPNTAYQNYEMGKASAGRPSTTVNVSADKPFSSALGTGAAGILDASSAAARGGAQTIGTVNNLRAALDSGKVTAGPGTTAIQFFNQVSGGDPEKLQATRATMQGLAKLTLDARASMKGQGTITDREQALLERAVSGDLDNITIPEIRTITDVAERAARAAIKANAGNVARARNVPGSGNVVDFYDVPEPPAYAPQKAGGGLSPAEQSELQALRNRFNRPR